MGSEMPKVPDVNPENAPVIYKNPCAIDLYCGCGSVTAALRATGFKVAAAVDNDPKACDTFALNHPDTHLHRGDIRLLHPKQISVAIGLQSVDLLTVCAPCQPFSSQNKHRSSEDSRNSLIFEAVRFAEFFQPKLIFFENVAGLASPAFSFILDDLQLKLKEIGYTIGKPEKVDAANFGVPQRRIRCILLASRDETVPEIRARKSITKTVRQSISHLKQLKSGEADERDSLHRARNHSVLNLKRLSKISKDGGSRSDLPPELQLRCHIGFSGHPDVYGRMGWDSVAPTLTTGCTDITRGRFAHPEQDRAITLREAAILQSFPRRYKFSGNQSEIARQIGNAVPYEMARRLFRRLEKEVRNRTRNHEDLKPASSSR